MFPTINAEYRAAKRADADNSLILESVLDVDETLPGSDEEMESIVDPDSVPDDVYAKIDKELDKIVEDPNYDDTEAEEMLDDDFDADDISDAEIDAIMDEAVAMMERKDKIAGVFANLSEKAGNNMGNSTGMGLLKTLSESVNQFQGGKMSDPIGKAYEPVETPDESIDETKLENEALKESAVEAALARFHSLMEASNPDVEDFPGKEGTTQADGDTPAGMPEPNGDEDGNNVGGDDQVVDQEAKEVGVEDGGSDAIDVIKANESVNRYRAIAESAKGEEKAMRIGGAITGGITGAVAGAIGGAKASKEVNAAKAELEKAEASGDASAVADAREKLRNAKVSSAKRGALKYGAVGAAAGHGLGHVTNKVDKMVSEAVTNTDVEDFPNQTGAGNDHGEKEGALPEGQEPADFPNSTGDKKVNSGDVPTNRYKAVAEAVTNPDVEDFPKAEGTHSAEGNGVPAGMSHEDDSVQPAYTDQSDFEQKEVDVEDGGTDAIDVIKANESAIERFRAIAESAKTDKLKSALEDFEKENPNATALEKAKAAAKASARTYLGKCPKCGKNPCECEC